MSILVNLSDRQIEQPFVVVGMLIVPVILGLDFLHKHRLILDFATCPIKLLPWPQTTDSYDGKQELQPVVDAVTHANQKFCATTTTLELTEETIDNCAIPTFGESQHVSYDLPAHTVHALEPLVHDFEDLFVTRPGATTLAEHFIPTSENPVKIPSRRIPAHYQVEVEKQLQSMMIWGHRSKFQPMDGTCSVCSEEVGRDSAFRGLQGIEQEDDEKCLPPPST